jgi:hypothetical protein
VVPGVREYGLAVEVVAEQLLPEPAVSAPAISPQAWFRKRSSWTSTARLLPALRNSPRASSARAYGSRRAMTQPAGAPNESLRGSTVEGPSRQSVSVSAAQPRVAAFDGVVCLRMAPATECFPEQLALSRTE